MSKEKQAVEEFNEITKLKKENKVLSDKLHEAKKELHLYNTSNLHAQLYLGSNKTKDIKISYSNDIGVRGYDGFEGYFFVSSDVNNHVEKGHNLLEILAKLLEYDVNYKENQRYLQKIKEKDQDVY